MFDRIPPPMEPGNGGNAREGRAALCKWEWETARRSDVDGPGFAEGRSEGRSDADGPGFAEGEERGQARC